MGTRGRYVSLTINDEGRGELVVKKYVCTVCGYVYDPESGDPDSGIEFNARNLAARQTGKLKSRREFVNFTATTGNINLPLYRDKVQILLDAVIFLAAFRAFRGEVPYPNYPKSAFAPLCKTCAHRFS